MIARVYKTNETVQGELWDGGLFVAEDGRVWLDSDVEILET